MTTDREPIAATQGQRVTRTFHDRHEAEKAVERLAAKGFGDDQVSMITHGGHTDPNGVFVPGGIEVVVLADDRADDAERILGSD
jgi:hypothetical protein